MTNIIHHEFPAAAHEGWAKIEGTYCPPMDPWPLRRVWFLALAGCAAFWAAVFREMAR